MHLAVVNRLLDELGAGEKPKLIVFNKTDMLTEERNFGLLSGSNDYVEISAKEGNAVETLLDRIENIVPGKKKEVTLLIPYDKGQILSQLHGAQTVVAEDYLAEGTKITCLLDAADYAKYRDFLAED